MRKVSTALLILLLAVGCSRDAAENSSTDHGGNTNTAATTTEATSTTTDASLTTTDAMSTTTDTMSTTATTGTNP